MARDLDILEASSLVAFVPSDEQTALKILLHERISPQVMGKLTYAQIESLEPFIAPFSMEKVAKWCKSRDFYTWLFLPDSFLLKIQKAKENAADTVIDLLNPEEGTDPKLAMVRLKAAELLLRTDMTKQQRVNNTIKVTNHLPKHLVAKSTDALEAELRKLKE